MKEGVEVEMKIGIAGREVSQERERPIIGDMRTHPNMSVEMHCENRTTAPRNATRGLSTRRLHVYATRKAEA